MIRLGLTGSIGMGKTTTALMFAEAGARAWDADAAVHALYAPGGEAGRRLRPVFPQAVDAEGGVDRPVLARLLEADPGRLKALETIVHPMVAEDRAAFVRQAEADGVLLAVLDIPLLYETGGERSVDAVVAVSAPQAVQRARVLARPGMDAERFALLLARQLPDAVKRERADFVIETGGGLDAARAAVARVVATVLQPDWKAK